MNEKTTPMMEQWFLCKKKAKKALLFFRLGDFYEAFYEDAKIISKEINLTLTKRQNIPMCGVPIHTFENYLDKLLEKGYKIAIAEQMEDPKTKKGLVKREVTRIITPGTLINSSLIDDKSNNFFISISQIGYIFGLAILDISTSEFKILELKEKKELKNELFKLKPKEILISEKFSKEYKQFFEEISYSFKFIINAKENWHFDYKHCYESLLFHFNVHSLNCFGLKEENIASINAAGALINYLKEELALKLDHIKKIKKEQLSYMSIDHVCFSSLEITDSPSNSKTLLNVIDYTLTPMGGRLLKDWIKHPLIDIKKIENRLDAIEEFIRFDKKIDSYLDNIKDLERIMMRIKSNFSNPKDLIMLKYSLENIHPLKSILSSLSSSFIKNSLSNLNDFFDLINIIKKSISDNPPFRVSDTGVIKDGYNKDLDELRKIKNNSKLWLINYQKKLRDELKIKTLKVGFNKIFGYYIEVSKSYKNEMPSDFQRKQTLVNSERFISNKLKDFEHKILSSDESIKALENFLYNDVRQKVSEYYDEVLESAYSIAKIDLIYSLSKLSKRKKYCRPKINKENRLKIKSGRHPIIETTSNNFIPNDTYMDKENIQIIITGPNMAGKSTYIRQVALITILAQMGSFVPAKDADISIVDKIFSRIGASDDLSRGQSTFMVEMSETANILNNATENSLVILDEIGRGTSTYDGISIAWAVSESLFAKKTKTLFATHYWELTELEEKIPFIKNYTISIKKTPQGIIFLRKIKKGTSNKSFGIEVAKLAGIPFNVIKRAEKILSKLEKKGENTYFNKERYPLFSYIESPIIEEIKKLDLNSITPLEALKKLFDLHKKVLK
ncbi:MAG: DNA mismatch repair protein MutS [Chlamydiae bacterium SM23_39]|nr:MAG: DNA mismatch repair protein MutS [Chlamydiae bacterium SM23_39]